MTTLGIETSCDETSIGIIKGNKLLANIVSSQIAHTRFGGVVPELAARNHIKILLPLIKIALETAGIELDKIDLIAATRGPGLLGSLLTGLSFAKSLAIGLKKPFVGVNHLEGHIYSLFLKKEKPEYPYLVLLVSGGHTELIYVKKEFKYQTLGRTLDDACGEAFDKVAKMLGLPYPGGPYIEKLAKEGNKNKIKFPVPKPQGFNFSYAGLKTAVLYYLRDNPDYRAHDVAAAFQETALEHLVQVSKRAIEYTKVKHFGIVGGVSVNSRLKEKFQELTELLGVRLLIPDLQFCTDNGAMIALAGRCRYEKFGPSDLSIDAVAREPLEMISRK
ncbi:MAG: tRNA (adenosine(37)-N6)-threonylcarbamoyltransferase complex transferase subunit TsaD [candidate division WOR-3 bacterium]